MKKLSDYFDGVIVKRLSMVETDTSVSNQHEFNGTALMKQILGTGRRDIHAVFVYVGVEEERVEITDSVTWYDARESDLHRSEHRLYFRDNSVMDHARPGDVLVAALKTDGSLLLLVVSERSEWLEDVLWMFGAETEGLERKLDIDPSTVGPRLESLFNYIAEAIGLDIGESVGHEWLDLLLDSFGPSFPTTRQLSALANETLRGEIAPVDAPDEAVVALMEREESMFRELERHIVSKRIASEAVGWAQDVDAFVSFSLSVHNRRKSRAGHALENHLEWIFLQNGLRFARGAITEGRSKPDFLFPGPQAYHDPSYPVGLLTMLGVKTTCKDRWRQILNEAARIDKKHLMTLQPGISEHQTNEMQQAELKLVVPETLHACYSTEQRTRLLSVLDFIEFVRSRKQNWTS